MIVLLKVHIKSELWRHLLKNVFRLLVLLLSFFIYMLSTFSAIFGYNNSNAFVRVL